MKGTCMAPLNSSENYSVTKRKERKKGRERERKREVKGLPQNRQNRMRWREEGIREDERETVDIFGGKFTLVRLLYIVWL